MTSGWKKAEKPKRKGSWIRVGVLCALIVAAGLLFWFQGGLPWTRGLVGNPAATAEPGATKAPTQGTALEKRSLRETAYEKDMASLAALTENQGVSPQVREDAAKQLQQMVAGHQTELAIDEALRSAGFSPCVTLLQNGALTVMVEQKELTGAQSATILSLCAAHTDVGLENIRIMTGERLGGE